MKLFNFVNKIAQKINFVKLTKAKGKININRKRSEKGGGGEEEEENK